MKTRTLLGLVALAALGFAGLREYHHPARAWRRAAGGANGAARSGAWGEARSGRIGGLDREATLAEVARAMDRGDARARAEAVQAFAPNEPDARVAVPRLADRLLDPDARVRLVAAGAIRAAVRPGGEGRDLAVHELAAALGHPDPELRRVAAEGLAALADRLPRADDPALGALRMALARDSDAGVRIASAVGLARVGVVGDGAVALLRSAIRDHSGPDCTRPHCVDALLGLSCLLAHSDEAAACLFERATRADRGARDAEAILTIKADQDDRARARVERRAGLVLGDPETEARAWAATLLLKIASTRAFLAIADPSTRRQAEQAVVATGRVDLRLVFALEAEVADPDLDPILRARAIEALQVVDPGQGH